MQPSLRYHESAPVFLLTVPFFARFPGVPGGLADYAAAFLEQCNSIDWLGALALALLAWALHAAVRLFVGRLAREVAAVAAFGPSFLLLLLAGSYDLPVFSIVLGLLLAVGMALAATARLWVWPWLRLLACWTGSAAVFWLAGFWPALLHGVLCGAYEWRRPGSPLVAGGCCLSSAIPLGWGLAGTASAQLLPPLAPIPVQGWVLAAVAALYLFIPVCLILLPRVWKPSARLAADSSKKKSLPVRGPVWRLGIQRHGRLLGMGLFALAWIGVWSSLDLQRREILRVGRHADHREWAAVLASAARLQATSSTPAHQVVRALFHTGRLLDDLFSFPLPPDFSLLPGLPGGLRSCRTQGELLLELGQAGAAEHFAHEALESEGERPETLKLLARINVLKERPRAARVFLNVLHRIPFHRAEAERALAQLDEDSRWSADPELPAIRERLVTTDQPGNALSAEDILRQCLHSHGRNRLAYDCQMAAWLLRLDLDKVAEGARRLPEFGYKVTPRHVSEALLLQRQTAGAPQADPALPPLRPETVRRFSEFIARIRAGAAETPPGMQALLRDFGDTYWFYDLSRRHSPGPVASTSPSP